jgi:arylsulfatase A-like enzyme
VDIQDFFPTVLEMAGIRHYKIVQHVDGKSIVPFLKDPGKRDDKRILVWNFPDDWRGGNKAKDNSWMTSIRQGDWKLIYFEEYGKLELYNLKKDIGESHDLSSQYPAEARRLAKLLTRRLKKYDAQRPVYKSTGKPVPWPDEIR